MLLPKEDKHFARYNGIYQRQQLLLALANVSNWRTAIDVGAHVGFHSVIMAPLFECVHAFEPQVDNFMCLVENVPDNVHPHYRAVGAEPGEVSLVNPLASNTGAWETVPGNECTMTSLDYWCAHLEHIDFIKIDVQGYENAVIRGAKHIIKEHKPTMMVELSKDEDEANKTIGKMVSYGLTPVFRAREDMIFAPPGKGMRLKHD